MKQVDTFYLKPYNHNHIYTNHKSFGISTKDLIIKFYKEMRDFR